MADNSVVISVEVDASGVAKGVEVVQQEVAKTEEKAKSLKAQMKALRDELGKVPEGSKDWQRLTGEIGKLKDKMDAMGESVKTVTGEPLERLNSSFSMVGSSLGSLDFGAAITGLQGTANAIRGVKFGDLTEATKGFGKTMLDLGKAIVNNPLFAIGGLIVAIITNFETLANAGGKIGAVFTKIGSVFTFLSDQITAFLDWTTLTDSKAAQMAKDAEARNKRMVEDLKKSNDAIKAMQETSIKDGMNARQKELYDIKKWFDEQLWLARGNADNQEKVKQLYRERVAQINSKYDEEERKKNEEAYKKRIEQEEQEAIKKRQLAVDELKEIKGRDATKLELSRMASLDLSRMNEDLAKSRAATEIAIEEQKRQTILEGEIALKNAKLEIAQQVLGGLMDLNSLLTDSGIVNAKKSFQINKALGIAQATIATYEGATNAFKTASASPITIGFPGYPALMAGIAVTAGLAKVAKIAATKFNPGSTTPPSTGGGGGGGGMGALGGSGGGGSTSAPALDLSFLNNAQTKAQPIQSYVLATNVTSAQDAQQKIIDQSKLIK